MMFEGMYKERHFMNGRDQDAYAKKQRGSCLFLIRRLVDWRVGLKDAPLRVVLEYLMIVHGRQYRDLRGRPGEKEPGSSFYYDLMLSKLAREGFPRIALHAVMYERGRRRYEELAKCASKRLKVWERFLWDATSNRDLCVCCLFEGHAGAADILEGAIDLEAELMSEIDGRNAEK